MARQSRPQKKTVKRVMHEYKHGELKTSRGKKVKSRKQAIAIGLSEARRAGKKVPKKKTAKKTAKKSTKKSAKKSAKKTSRKTRSSRTKKSRSG